MAGARSGDPSVDALGINIEGKPPPSSGRAVPITPRSSVTVLRTGWGSVVPLLHPTALGSFAA